jgi:hypothetical protein
MYLRWVICPVFRMFDGWFAVLGILVSYTDGKMNKMWVSLRPAGQKLVTSVLYVYKWPVIYVNVIQVLHKREDQVKLNINIGRKLLGNMNNTCTWYIWCTKNKCNCTHTRRMSWLLETSWGWQYQGTKVNPWTLTIHGLPCLGVG